MPGKRASASQSSAVSAFSGILVAGDEGDRGGVVAVGHRDAGVGARRDPAGDAGHDLELDSGLAQRFPLLAATAEDERIAALQPHHALPRPRRLDQLSPISAWGTDGLPGALPT